jgi:peptidoglycan/LPS O-acetylase OafA/YrhL
VLSHVGAPAGAENPLLKSFLSQCYAGVTVFFVLSGFVLAHNYFERFVEKPSVGLLHSYVVARLARVYPLYLLWLAWVALPTMWKPTPAQVQLLWKHALALQAWEPSLKDAFAFNSPGWSISVEFFLYACFPLLVLLLVPIRRSSRGTGVALAVVALAMAGVTLYFEYTGRGDLKLEHPDSAHHWLYRYPATRLGDFLLGMLAARLVRLRAPLSELGAAALATGSTVVALVLMCWPSHNGTAASWDVSFALPSVVLIYALASAPASLPARLLSSKPLLLLGESSYALYLCHRYIINLTRSRSMPPEFWMPTKALAVVVVIALSVGLHLTIEKPCRSFFRWLLDPAVRQQKRRVAAAQFARAAEGELSGERAGAVRAP